MLVRHYLNGNAKNTVPLPDVAVKKEITEQHKLRRYHNFELHIFPCATSAWVFMLRKPQNSHFYPSLLIQPH